MPAINPVPQVDPYQSEGGKVYHESINGGVGSRGYMLVARRRAAKLQPFISSDASVLEFGIGPGWNLAAIKARSRKGYDVATAVRPLVEAQGIEFVNELIEQDSAAYDIVICSHVLEHLKNPGEALLTIMDCLKDDGKALLFIPFDKERKFRKYDEDEPNHHLYSWNVQSFANLLMRYGFVVMEYKLRLFGYERIIAIWVERFRLPDWMYSLLLFIVLRIKPSYEIAFVVKKSNIHPASTG